MPLSPFNLFPLIVAWAGFSNSSASVGVSPPLSTRHRSSPLATGNSLTIIRRHGRWTRTLVYLRHFRVACAGRNEDDVRPPAVLRYMRRSNGRAQVQDHLHQLRLHPRLLRPLTSAPHAPSVLARFDPDGSAIEPLAQAAAQAAGAGEAGAIFRPISKAEIHPAATDPRVSWLAAWP